MRPWRGCGGSSSSRPKSLSGFQLVYSTWPSIRQRSSLSSAECTSSSPRRRRVSASMNSARSAMKDGDGCTSGGMAISPLVSHRQRRPCLNLARN
jgi:hypothetical protein